jgi:uncharacterized protein (TIGR02246 family)
VLTIDLLFFGGFGMYRKCILLVAGLTLAILGAGFMTAQDKTGKGPNREADKQAIEKLAKDFIQAFNKRDAAGIAAHWTAEGEFIRNDGQPIRGKSEIEKGYADFFKTVKNKSQVEIQFDGINFPSADTAYSEVTLRLKNEEGEVVASSWRNTLLVREGGQWKVAMVREWDRDVGLDANLSELAWLIGTWQAATKDREVTISYKWDDNKMFINGKYTVKEGAKVVESGTQIIGKDNAEGTLRSWTFQSDGGWGGGVWTREGKKWSVDVYGVTPEGKELTATSVYVHVDPATFTWQAVGQALNGEPIPDTQPLKVTKEKSAK